MSKIAKDTPLVEITLRRYEKPAQLDERDLVRKLCLSLGLLQPGDSRDVIVDIFCILLHYRNQKMDLSSEEVTAEVIAYRKKQKLPLVGVASSNIRRQLRRLRELMLVEKLLNNYRITEFCRLHELIEEKVERFLLSSILSRVKEYIQLVDLHFLEHGEKKEVSNKENGDKRETLLN